MKNILCYVGIIILLGLVLFPPILRMTLPEKTEEERKVERSNYILSCSNERFIVNTSYEDEKVKMLAIKKKLTQQEIDKRKQLDENIENLDEQLIDNDSIILKYQEVVNIFERIKEKATVNYEVIDDGEILSIDFSVDEHKELDINKLIQKISNQQLYYEKLGFACTIK